MGRQQPAQGLPTANTRTVGQQFSNAMDRVTLLRNAAMVGVASTVESGLGLVAGVIIARTLGPTDYGHYSYSIWLCGVILMLVNHGLPLSAIRFLAEARGSKTPGLAGPLLRRLVRLQTLSALIILAAFIVEDFIIPIDDWKDAALTMLAISVVAIWTRADLRFRGAVGKGFELFVPENLTLMVMAPVNLALVAYLAWRGAGVVGFFGLYAAIGVASCLLVRYFLHRYGVRSGIGDLPAELSSRLNRHLALTGVLLMLYALANRAVEMTLLKAHTDAATVGYFAIAVSLTKGAVDLLAGGMAAVLLPTMSKRYGQGGMGQMGRLVGESTRLFWSIGLAIAGLGVTITDGAIRLLYGARFEPVIPALTYMLVVSGLLIVNAASSAALSATDRQAERIRIVLAMLIVNLVLGLVLIPRYGLNGALASYSISMAFEAVVAAWRVRRHTEVALPLAAMLRCTLAALLAAALGWWVGRQLTFSLGFVVAAAVFTLAYTTLTVLLRAWRAEEFEVVASLLGRWGRPGQRAAARVLRWRDRYSFAEAVS